MAVSRVRDARTIATEATTRTVEGPAGRTVAYAEYGDPDGTPVLFFHGTPGSRLLGALYADAADERAVRLLAVDRPGYGRSSPRPDRTLADTPSFATPVLDDAGVEEAGVVGFSGGGPHALALATSRGERVRSVALVGSAVPPDCVENRPRPQRLLEGMATRAPWLLGGLLRVQRWLAGRSTDVVTSQYAENPDSVPAEVAEVVRRDFREALARSRNGVVVESRLFGRAWDVDPAAVDVPVVSWHGERDGNVPLAAARRFADRLSGDLRVLDGADHLGSLLGARESVLERLALPAPERD